MIYSRDQTMILVYFELCNSCVMKKRYLCDFSIWSKQQIFLIVSRTLRNRRELELLVFVSLYPNHENKFYKRSIMLHQQSVAPSEINRRKSATYFFSFSKCDILIYYKLNAKQIRLVCIDTLDYIISCIMRTSL